MRMIEVDSDPRVDRTGQQDNAMVLREMVDQNPEATFIFGKGVYAFSKGLNLKNNQRIVGSGMHATILKKLPEARSEATPKPVLNIEDYPPDGAPTSDRPAVVGVSISDCTIDGNGVSKHGIRGIKTHFLLVERVLVHSARGYGIGLQISGNEAADVHQYPRIIDCVIQENFNDGVDVKNASKLFIRGCSVRRNGEHGLDLRGDGIVSDTYSENNGQREEGSGLGAACGIRCRVALPRNSPFDFRIANCRTKGNRFAGFYIDATPPGEPSCVSIVGCRALDASPLHFENRSSVIFTAAGNHPPLLNH